VNENQQQPLIITAYCDADWAGSVDDRKSTTGYCVYLNGNIVSWNTKKQHTVALSTAEAELMAITEVLKEVRWLTLILEEMKYEVKKPVKIFTDNQAAMKMSQNDIEHDRSKHIDIRHYAIRDYIKKNEIIVQYINTAEQVADMLTKSLQKNIFTHLRSKIMKMKQV
jgi:hypothetical protein